MIGDYPITWLVTELVSIVLFSFCLRHALSRPDAKTRVMELLCFVIASAIFEHVGVLYVKGYDYDLHRIMMVGVLPLSTLLIEACTVYTGMLIFEKMKLPAWTSLWVVGFWCTFCDLGIDPVYAFDAYEIDGVMRAQWNWQDSPLNLLGIPFYNFDGWLLMCGMYALLLFYCRKLAGKKPEGKFAALYPFICAVFLIVAIVICSPLTNCPVPLSSEKVENIYSLVVLILNTVMATVLYVKGCKKMEPVDLKENWVIPAVALSLDAYNLIVGIVRGISTSYITTLLVLAVHLFFLWKLRGRATKSKVAAQ